MAVPEVSLIAPRIPVSVISARYGKKAIRVLDKQSHPIPAQYRTPSVSSALSTSLNESSIVPALAQPGPSRRDFDNTGELVSSNGDSNNPTGWIENTASVLGVSESDQSGSESEQSGSESESDGNGEAGKGDTLVTGNGEEGSESGSEDESDEDDEEAA